MDIRAVLADLMNDEGIDDFEFAAMMEMLEEEERENRAMFLRNFSLDDFTEVGCEENFRFSKDEITRLCQLMRFPDTMTAVNGTIAPGLEVLCIVLKRLSYPCRYMDLERFFCRPRREVCSLFNLGANFLHDTFGTRITDFDQPWLQIPKLIEYCAAIHAKGSPLYNCWGFIDGTVRETCKPSMHQREVYNGHKKFHGLKFQSVVLPTGLIANMHGPLPGRRHDAALLNQSGLMEHMEAHFYAPAPDGRPLCLFGDQAYPLRPHLLRPHRGGVLTPEEQMFNTENSKVRQGVEWQFGRIVQLWAFLDFKNNLKLFLSPVGMLYVVGALLTNCHLCIRGHNETSLYFGLDPPTIEEYLY